MSELSMSDHPTVEEFSSMSDAALAQYFRWYQDKDEVQAWGFEIERDGILPHLGEQIEFLQDHDPDWLDVFRNVEHLDKLVKTGPPGEALHWAVWSRMKELLERGNF